MVSVLTVTLNRYELTRRCLDRAFEKAGCKFEFLAWDQNSSDARVKQYLESLHPAFLRLSAENKGYAPAVNQMILRAAGEYLCILDPDIEVPDNWLSELVRCAEAIPESGISSIHCVEKLWAAKVINGVMVHPGRDVFGIKFFHRTLLESVGYFCEDYGLYGLEDRDMLERIAISKLFVNYYVGGLKAVHAGNDVDNKDPYRAMKWEALKKAYPIMMANTKRYHETGQYFVPAPELV